jgi:hypothetical protein
LSTSIPAGAPQGRDRGHGPLLQSLC